MTRFLVYSLAFSACFLLVTSEIIIPYTLSEVDNQPQPGGSLTVQPQQQQQNSSQSPVSRVARAGVKDLKLSVTNDGKSTEQVVDNQQGQIVKQTVGPEGIYQTVFRNGVKITDDIVPNPSPSV